MSEDAVALNFQHPFLCTGYNSILIDGFVGVNMDKCFCIVANGQRYLDHGITTGSILFCQRSAPIKDRDLVVVEENNGFAVYLYLKNRQISEIESKRILHNKSKAYAKVLGSFNFYH